MSLGSNVGNRKAYLRAAVKLLKTHKDINIRAISSVYETEPEGYKEQKRFFNLVLEVETSLTLRKLFGVCQTIEELLKRKREIKWGPRTIDLDILLYDDLELKDEILAIPHPKLHRRLFVLIPLLEIAPELKFPSGYSLKSLYEICARDIGTGGITLIGSLFD